MQIISKNQTVRSDTKLDLKDFNSQSLSTQTEKGEQLVFMTHVIRKAFYFGG